VKAERPKGSEDEPEYKVGKEDFIFGTLLKCIDHFIFSASVPFKSDKARIAGKNRLILRNIRE
jgi:hypothetical protein